MTQIFQSDGRRLPVTVIKVGPCAVIARKSKDQHGYDAVQLGFEKAKPSRVTKPLKGIFAKANVDPVTVMREFRVDDPQGYPIGEELTVARFEVDQYVDVTGTTIGRGFSGVVKRWGFRGGRASHGANKVHRSGGSLGQCQTPGRVYKNKKMAGHAGDDRLTVLSLRVAAVDLENHLLVVKGSIPGAPGTLVLVRDAVKKAHRS